MFTLVLANRCTKYYSFVLILRVFVNAHTEPACNSSLTSRLRNDQFSASSQYDAAHNASVARKNDLGWISNSFDRFQYLQVDLEGLWEITAMDMDGSSNDWFTRTFRVSYSLDGIVWVGYNTRQSNDPLGEIFERTGNTTSITFTPSIQTRFIVFNPVEFSGYSSLRIELYGCERSSESPPKVITKVTADIEFETTWIPTQSPIVIDRLITVRPSGKLTIQAGVSIFFTTPESGLDLFGSLSVEGIPGLDVLLSSNHPVLSARSKWQGLKQGAGGNIKMTHVTIRQAVVGVQGDGSRTHLSRTSIHSCQYGLRLSGGLSRNYSSAKMVTGMDMFLFMVHVHNNEDGLQVYGKTGEDAIIIGYSKFENNDISGIRITNWEAIESNVWIDSNLIKTNLFLVNSSLSFNLNYGISNWNYGIWSQITFHCNFYIHNSSFIGNRNKGIYYYRYYSDSPNDCITISNSTFSENRNDGIQIYCYQCQQTNITFVNNVFKGHSQEAIYIYLDVRVTGTNSTLLFENNTFTNNMRDINGNTQSFVQTIIINNLFSMGRLPIKLSSNVLDKNKATISGNNFTNINAQTTSEIAVEINGVITDITSNTFNNCTTPYLITLKKGYSHSVSFNKFFNSSSSLCYLKVEEAYDPIKYIAMDNNYWGTTEKLFVKSKVCDFFHDSRKTRAVLNNFYPTSQMDEPISSADIDTFRYERDTQTGAYVVGGVIDKDIDLLFLDGETIIVNRSILILDDANVTIGRTVVNFTTSRGIAIQGALSIGNAVGQTILQKHTRDDWSGISTYSANVMLTKFTVTGVSRFISVYGNISNISVNTCSRTENVQTFLYTDALNGELRFDVLNSTINTQATSFYFRTNNSAVLDIEIKDSVIRSDSFVLDVRETNTQSDKRQINVKMENSSFYSGRDWIFYLSTCHSHISCKLSHSFFSTNSYANTIFLQSPSIDFTADGNTFSDTSRVMQFQFCENINELVNFSKVVNMTNNILNSSFNGEDIYIYKWYTHEVSHELNIINNIFEHRKTNRKGVIFSGQGYQNYGMHSLMVKSNTFSNMEGRVFDISYGLDRLVFINNTFQNNTQCIYLSGSSSQGQILNGLEILNNKFANNNHTGGVVFVDRQDVVIYPSNISFNIFENNTGSILIFRSSDMIISFNVFENYNALYNLKIGSIPNVNPDKVVNATLNFWGTTNIREIAKKIYDSDYDADLLDVIFRPYLGSRNNSDIQDEDVGFVIGNEIGGQVNGNVTLRLSGSPYVAVSNIEVGENDTLIVDAGVEIRVKQDIGIHVLGILQVLGTEESRVKIYPDISSLPWRGIDIDSIRETILRYLTLDGTLLGIKIRGRFLEVHNITSINSKTTGITVDMNGIDASLNFSQLYAANNTARGIYITGNAKASARKRRGTVLSDSNSKEVTVYISDCEFNKNALHGIQIESNVKVAITNCLIKNNVKIGVRIQSSENGTVSINNSIISNNSEQAILAYLTKGLVIQSSIIRDHSYGYRTYWNYWSTREYILLYKQSIFENTTVLIKDSKFINNIANGIRFDILNVEGSSKVVIEGNVFSGGNRTLVLNNNFGLGLTNHLCFDMNANSIEDNMQIDERQSDHLLKFNLGTMKEFIMRNNRFQNNTADTCVFLEYKQTSNSVCDIQQNKFLDNSISSNVFDIFYTKPIHFILNFNVFDSRYPTECIIKAPRFDLSFNINATHNYWGTKAFQQIVELVCDFQKDMEQSLISYLPFYEDDRLTTLSQGEQNHFNVSGVYGGEISQDLFITRSMFPKEVRINRSMMISVGASVSIESGVVMKFAENRGIYVQGILMTLVGLEPVRLENSADTKWFGLVFNSTETGKSSIYNTKIYNTSYGVIAYTPQLEFRKSDIINSMSNCLTLYQNLK